MVRPPSPPSHRHNCRSASSVSTATVPPRHHLQTPPHCLFPSAPDGSRAWGLGLHRGVILSQPPSLQCRHLLAIAISLSSSSLRHRLLFAIAISSPPARRRRLYTAAVLLWRPFIGVPSHRHLFITLPFVTTALLTPPPPSLRPPPYLLFIYSSLPSPHRRRRRLFTAAAVPSLPPSLFAPPSLLAAVIHCGVLDTAVVPSPPPTCHPISSASLSHRRPLVTTRPPSPHCHRLHPLSLHRRHLFRLHCLCLFTGAFSHTTLHHPPHCKPTPLSSSALLGRRMRSIRKAFGPELNCDIH